MWMRSRSRTASPSVAGSPERAERIVREGARVLLADPSGKLLLLRAHDPHDPQRSWWFTPGGGVDPGESAREAAARELREETGHIVNPDALEGPVWERVALFDFMSEPYVQHEVFFVARVDADAAAPAGEPAWTDTELDTVDEVAWLAQPQVADAAVEVFPEQLREAWSVFLDWDGTTRDLGTVGE